MTVTIDSQDQHNREIQENKVHWQRKACLRKVYGRFYQRIASWLRHDLCGFTVEIGSGIGQIKEFIPKCVTTDLFANPGIDRVESAYATSFESGSIANLILFDVWHHLEYPGEALKEFKRVMMPGGRVILFEPAMGWIPRLVYFLFHHEPLRLRESIVWSPPNGRSALDFAYFAGQSRAHRIFVKGEGKEHLVGWSQLAVERWSDFAYIGSGGFRGPQLYPEWALPAVTRMDHTLTTVSKAAFAARMLIVLECSEEKRPC